MGGFNSDPLQLYPELPTRCLQALAFPDQLYDAVFDGAQVTSKTPIRLYGGALLSEYCQGRLGVVMSSWGPTGTKRSMGKPFFVQGLPFHTPPWG